MHGTAQSALILIVLALASPAEEPKYDKPKPLPEDRAVDTYDVYDTALARPVWGQPYSGAKYYIIDRSIKPNHRQPEKCIYPPGELRGKVSEVLADLAAQDDAYTIQPRFKLDKPYEMVSFDSHYLYPVGTIQLSVVSFSKDRSLALVILWSKGGSQWRVFTRGEKGWEEQHWTSCGAIF